MCVSDCGARAFVVVNQAVKLRFTNNGHPSTTKGSFSPVSISTDSQNRILAEHHWNNRIHILDQDGQFFRYIRCYLQRPWGLRLDTWDNILLWSSFCKQTELIIWQSFINNVFFSIDVSKLNFVYIWYIWYICKWTDCLLNIK